MHKYISRKLTLLPRCLGLSEYLSDILLSNASALFGERRTIPAAAATPLMSASLRVISLSFFFSLKDVATLPPADGELHVNATVEQDIPARVMIVLSRSFIRKIVVTYILCVIPSVNESEVRTFFGDLSTSIPVDNYPNSKSNHYLGIIGIANSNTPAENHTPSYTAAIPI